MYSDSITMERVTEDGTYYFFNSREKEEVKKIEETLKEVIGKFFPESLVEVF